MVLTDKLIRMGQSKAGGWSKPQLDLIGVSWPPRHGWIKKAVGTWIPDFDFDVFIGLKDKHLEDVSRGGDVDS